jgi:alkylresorcinol/alkylpyrone synthase
LASTLLAQIGSGTALVVSVELSTLGMQVAEPSMTDMVANLLFGDGAAAAVLAAERSGRGPEMLASQSVLWPDTLDYLGMKLTDTGFRLVLSSELPKVARSQLGPALSQFLARHRLTPDDIGFWIVHPGGPKVLEAVAQALSLSDRALQPSWETWERFGNLSSANVFFVLRHLQQVAPPRPGELGLMLALGPGIACEMLLLRSGGWLGR